MPWQPPPDYPDRLLCNGRTPDQTFSPTEKLFFRLPPLQPDEDEYDDIPSAKLPPLPISLNRERYSRPNDVLFARPDYGIAVLRVQDLPVEVNVKATGGKYELRLEHDPVHDEETDNYAHTEIRVYCEGARVDSSAIDKRDRLAIKESISRVAKVYKKPSRKPPKLATH